MPSAEYAGHKGLWELAQKVSLLLTWKIILYRREGGSLGPRKME